MVERCKLPLLFLFDIYFGELIMGRIPIMIQMQNSENGATALSMMLGYYGRFVPIEEMREVCISSRNGSSPEQIAAAAEHYGLKAKIETISSEELKNRQFPIMIRWKKRYYAIIKSIRNNIVTIIDPASGDYKMEFKKLEQLFTGTVITFEKSESFETGGRQYTLLSLVFGRLRPLLGKMMVILIFTAICIIFNIAMLRMNRSVIDDHLGVDDNAVIVIFLVYFFLMSVYVLFSFLKTNTIDKTSRRASAKSGISLFKKIMQQPMRFFEQYSVWDIMSRLDTNITLDSSILQTFVPRMIDAVMCIIYLAYLFSQSVIMTICCIVILAVSIAINLFLQQKTAIAAKSMTTSGNSVNASILNGMNMIDTIKSTGSERSYYRMWHDSQMKYKKDNKKQLFYSSMSSALTTLSGNVLQALQLFMGAYFVARGNFTLGGMALFQGLLGSMISSVSNCMSTATKLQTMRTGIERINDINNREGREAIPLTVSEDAPRSKLSGRISAKDLCFRYNKGDDLALDHVSIDVAPGQMVAIVGSTGCGKSTLLKVLADLYTPESGEVYYDGWRRNEIPDVVFHSSVSTVDQEAMMFEDSIYNNIRMWDSTIENYEIILAARDAQIHNRIVREKKDYGAMIEENGRNFSGGELQRLELARALAHEPTLLLLDEFTSALDALTEEHAMNSIREKGTTCVIVAHRLSTIVDCDMIYVMDHGRIVQKGTHKELYAQEGLYRQLIG